MMEATYGRPLARVAGRLRIFVALDRSAAGKDRHGHVIAVQSLGGQDVALDQRTKPLQGRRAGADLVC